MYLNGDYNSETAALLKITVEKCQGYDYCQPEEELVEFFETSNKLIMLLTNQIRFDTFQLGEDSIIEESVLKWLPLDPEGLFR